MGPGTGLFGGGADPSTPFGSQDWKWYVSWNFLVEESDYEECYYYPEARDCLWTERKDYDPPTALEGFFSRAIPHPVPMKP